ncbi:hypothetical protein BGW36DRAFT_361254 [Talaromyces proteolyticus]|uniref:Secreted protein n=1 Tax=Talaromyces proteolyticus TaxID=1131652 RepID=A0AAD4PYV0_9EURO|nr:uncharacterized protein BGW36DRAFT_361254 [Talaromyces proteolyticus]KAH8695563.1 hypothetical protein BGW36DRAFT_361254 [Talaromyces proteolyticus]
MASALLLLLSLGSSLFSPPRLPRRCRLAVQIRCRLTILVSRYAAGGNPELSPIGPIGLSRVQSRRTHGHGYALCLFANNEGPHAVESLDQNLHMSPTQRFS